MTDKVAPTKQISIYLPDDRWQVGALVFDEGGRTKFACPCRGKADGQRAARERNPTRDRDEPFGDTPAGKYRPARWYHYEPEHVKFGAGFLPLVGVEGRALEAVQHGRTGLGIHAGRGDGHSHGALKLPATHGCIRVRGSDCKILLSLSGDDEVAVAIFNTFG